ncbi:DNA gyrase inhibitor YacG [Litorivicinus lipolyticus]|uniref:DNA gyrase inhibitor YacG n=1 Tax=Litorivicinus lipolyticus TaxID=418701 RepID=UPI003B5A0573
MNPQLVKCPECGTSCRFDSSNPHKPFCSERCKLLDLGGWASESYKVPGPAASDELMSDQIEGAESNDDK